MMKELFQNKTAVRLSEALQNTNPLQTGANRMETCWRKNAAFHPAYLSRAMADNVDVASKTGI